MILWDLLIRYDSMNDIFYRFVLVHDFLMMTSTLIWCFGLYLLRHFFEFKELFVIFMIDLVDIFLEKSQIKNVLLLSPS